MRGLRKLLENLRVKLSSIRWKPEDRWISLSEVGRRQEIAELELLWSKETPEDSPCQR